MFHKKKVFAPGTFIPTRTRIAVILQLSLACTLLMWCFLQPFMGDFFQRQSSISLYRTVMGDRDLAQKVLPEVREETLSLLARNQMRFESLPAGEQQQIKSDYTLLQIQHDRSFGNKLIDGLKILFFDLHPFAKLWLLFSIIVCLMILLRIEGGQQGAFVVLLVTLLYVTTNWFYGEMPRQPGDAALFPTEEQLYHQYIKEPIASDILKQREQLVLGWHSFLVDHYASMNASTPLEDAEFAFNCARIRARRQDASQPAQLVGAVQESPIALTLYMVWALFFAVYVNRRGALFDSPQQPIYKPQPA